MSTQNEFVRWCFIKYYQVPCLLANAYNGAWSLLKSDKHFHQFNISYQLILLSGSLKVKTKGGVTQWDIAADFQTKQLASRMIGYYTVNGPTHGTKLNIDYQFYGNPKQNIKLEALYSERPMAYRHDLYAELSMEFTAYPGYNFYSIIRNVVSCNWIYLSYFAMIAIRQSF